MNLDKNTVIGFVLLIILFFGYFFFTRQGQLELEAKQKRMQDSLALIMPRTDAKTNIKDSVQADSLNRVASAGDFVAAVAGKEEITMVENDLMKVYFTNKGGQIKEVELKKYLSNDSVPVKLGASPFDKFSYRINTGASKIGETDALFFQPGKLTPNDDGSQTLVFELSDTSGKSVKHIYTIRPDQYMMDWNIVLNSADQLLGKHNIDLTWQVRAVQQEHDILTEKRETQINLLQQNGFDYFTMKDGLNKKWEEGMKWISIKQKFFNHTIVAVNGFSSAEMNTTMPADSTKIVANAMGNLTIPVPAGMNANIPLKIYYGPNDFEILKSYKMEMEDMVNLGQGMYAFVKYINRYIVMPFFNFISGFFQSYGVVILLLTLFIRLITSPLVYTSYLSSAKMKALRPELDVLKAKLKDDQQAYSMEQMKLFRSAGVNPLGGCIPALLQIPIFFALYSFFNSNISLRGQSFWWASDLSSYDQILTWSYSIPFIGNHISLFTLLAVFTNLLISIYSMNMTPDQDNPMMKYMPYIFPVMLLGVFNGLPAALTWYYTISNIITLIFQFVIQNYIIDHNKILAQLEENKKKPKAQPKWQEKMEQIKETQKKLDDMKNKTSKK